MCDPVIASTAMAAGSVIQAYDQYQSGEYQEDVASENARIAKLQAKQARTLGGMEEDRYRRSLAILQGKQRAAAGASGRDITGGGTVGDLLSQTSGVGELDALTIRSNAAREAWGFNSQAVNYKAQGKMAQRAGRLGAVSTLLTGGAQAGGMYMNA